MDNQKSAEIEILVVNLLPFFDGHSLLVADCAIRELRRRLLKSSYEAPIAIHVQEPSTDPDRI